MNDSSHPALPAGETITAANQRGPADGTGAAQPPFAPPQALPGYELLRELHRGGQGVVYEALQKSTKRRVAVKFMREGPFAGSHDQARFEREVEILGQLKHPNIVTIHDSGAAAGHFYYVMDYIPGKSLDQWIAEFGIWNLDSGPPAPRAAKTSVLSQSKIQNPKSKLETALVLFAKVCDAVNAAHLLGIIHRDLKPGNVLADEAGEPHVLDFGLAKRTVGEGSAVALTETGQFVGSVPWSAPEQAEGAAHKIDLRTDVYALGVILYQILTDGAFPYLLQNSLAEALSNIQYAEPKRPRLVRPEIGDELETIALKCLQKERERRYQTAGELARDVRHYLAGEPIEAKRDSGWYLLRKMLRRHRGAVAGGAAFMLLLLGALVALTFLYQGQVRERRRAENALQAEAAQRALAEANERQAQQARGRAEQIAQFMQETLAGARPSAARGRDTTMLREMLDAAAKRIEAGELKSVPEAEIQLRLSIGEVYRDLAHGDAYARAEQMLKPALDQARARYPGDHPDVANGLGQMALLLHERGDPAAAEPLYRAAAEMYRRLHPGDHADVAASVSNFALFLMERGDREAEPLLREALAMRRRLYSGDHASVASSIQNLGVYLQERGQSAAAEPLLREALAMTRRLFPGDYPETATILNNLGLTRQEQDDMKGAEPFFREAFEMNRRIYPGDHPSLITNLNNLADLLVECGQLADAERLLRESLDMSRRLYPGDHQFVARGINNLARLLSYRNNALGDAVSAENLATVEALYREALGMCRRLYPGGHPYVVGALNNLAMQLKECGDFSGAEALYREALDMGRQLYPAGHVMLAGLLNNLASVLRDRGESAAAEPLFREAVEFYRTTAPAGHSRLGQALSQWGDCLLRLRRFADAEKTLLEAEGILSQPHLPPSAVRHDVLKNLVVLYEAWNAAEPERGHAAQAVEWRTKLERWRATTRPKSP